MTSNYSYKEILNNEIEKLYKIKWFSNIIHLTCEIIIKHCWDWQVNTAQKMYDYLEFLDINNVL